MLCASLSDLACKLPSAFHMHAFCAPAWRILFATTGFGSLCRLYVAESVTVHRILIGGAVVKSYLSE